MSAAVLLVAVCAATVVRSVDGEPAAASPLTISPVVAPSGGFAVPQGQMDGTLRELVDDLGVRSAESADDGEGVLVDRAVGGLRRAVQTGAVLVDTSVGQFLVEVDVRRSQLSSCTSERCVEVARTAATTSAPRSVMVVVDRAGVRVGVRAWAGPHRDSVTSLDRMPLSMRDLLSVAAHQVWRAPDARTARPPRSGSGPSELVVSPRRSGRGP